MMRKKKVVKSRWWTVGFVVMLLFVVLVSMLFGTTIGYDQALASLTGCEEVACSELGINASKCEICSKPTLASVVLECPCTGGA